jgi:quercetin dioxygenase-like cupin family protein
VGHPGLLESLRIKQAVKIKQAKDDSMTPNEGEQLNQTSIPPDDLTRSLVVARADDAGRPHIGLVGDTYTVLLSGKDTAGRFCVIDMHVPPGGGPPPHRHDFEESFVLLEGELEATFRGVKSLVKAGETVHVPANAPHQFHNASNMPVRMLCICSPAGQEEFFAEVGVPVASRTAAPAKLDPAEQKEFMAKALALAGKYRTEFLEHA